MEPRTEDLRLRDARRSAGFTLLELMIVVAIVGLMSATAVPIFEDAMAKSQRTAVRADCGAFYRAFMTYRSDYDKFPSEADFDLETLDPLHSEGYFAGAPAFTSKLQGGQVLLYLTPDVDGPDSQLIVVTRSAADPDDIFVIVYTDIIEATDGWVYGVHIIDDGDLEQAEEIE